MGILDTKTIDVCDYDNTGKVTKGNYIKTVKFLGIKVRTITSRLNVNKNIKDRAIGLKR